MNPFYTLAQIHLNGSWNVFKRTVNNIRTPHCEAMQATATKGDTFDVFRDHVFLIFLFGRAT